MSILATRETLTHVQDHPLVASRLSWLAERGIQVVIADGDQDDLAIRQRSEYQVSGTVAIPADAGVEASAAQLEIARLLVAGWPLPTSCCELISLEAAAWRLLDHEDVYEAILELARNEIRCIDAGEADILRLWQASVLIDEEDRRQLLFQVSRLDEVLGSELAQLIEVAPTAPASRRETGAVARALRAQLEA